MQIIRSFLFSIVTIFLFVTPTVALPSMRIIDGTRVSETEFPNVARLSTNGELLCTGTLVGTKYILTAAHCFFGENNARAVGDSEVVVRLNGEEYNSSVVSIHPDYRSRNSACVDGESDAAVIELASEVSGVNPAPLLESPVPVGASVILAGYGTQGSGTNGENGSIPDLGLINYGSTVVEGFGDDPPKQDSASSYFYWSFDRGESNHASGDSGGPAFYEAEGQQYLAGITCGGTGNAEIGSVSFDTRVDLIAAWVQSITGTTPVDTPVGLSSLKSQGASIGKAFTYKIPATGTTPILLNVTGLPDGLTFDGSKITGTPTVKGNFPVQVSAANSFGKALKEFIIVVSGFDPSLSIKKVLLQFDEGSGSNDFLDVTGKISVGSKFSPKGKSATIVIGRFSKTFKLKSNGQSAGRGKSYFDLSGSFKGKSFAKSVVSFALTFEKIAIFEELATLGFPTTENATAGQIVALPITITLNGIEASTTINLKFRSSDQRWIISK